MPVNSTHPEYDANLPVWQRARDVLGGEDAIKRAGIRYLPRLDSQSDHEFAAYLARASFYNATARTANGCVGMVFRKSPFVKLPTTSGLSQALAAFANDVDMLGTPLTAYAKNVVSEVIAVGRAGTLVDWEGEVEDRAYATLYSAECILNWRVERINGRNVPTLIVLHEPNGYIPVENADAFVAKPAEQIRVLKLVPGGNEDPLGTPAFFYRVEIWRKLARGGGDGGSGWVLVEVRTPLRRGKPLPQIPFIFHGPRHSLPCVDKLPLADVINVNLDHFRLDADYKHGVHYTALPTAYVSGFDKGAALKIGSSEAWVSETLGAHAGFLEFTGQGLSTFERAMDRDERFLAVLGSRLLAEQKRVGETAEAMELRQAGENSILANLAISVSRSLTQVLRWAYWWNSTDEIPDSVPDTEVLLSLNTDYSTKGLAAEEVVAVVKAWQSGAISTDTMHELFRRGEMLPDGRTNAEELALIARSHPPVLTAVPKGPAGTVTN